MEESKMTFREHIYADIRIEEVKKTIIGYENGKLRQNKESATKGAFLRVFDGNRWYYCATTELENLQQELDSLMAMATPKYTRILWLNRPSPITGILDRPGMGSAEKPFTMPL